MCGSPRSCITSTSIVCGRRIGRFSPNAAPGVDGVTWRDYGLDLEANLRDLHARVHRGALPGEAVAEGVHTEGGRAAAAARGRPGRPGTLLCPAPLRTVRAGFPAHGSSKP